MYTKCTSTLISISPHYKILCEEKQLHYIIGHITLFSLSETVNVCLLAGVNDIDNIINGNAALCNVSGQDQLQGKTWC